MKHVVVSALTFSLIFAVEAHAVATPQARCEAAKNKAAGKYAACLQSAASKLAATAGSCSGAGQACYRSDECPVSETCDKETERYDTSVAKCGAKLVLHWQKAEAKAADAGASCPDAPLLSSDFKSAIDSHRDNISSGLAGNGLGNLAECTADLATCDGALSNCTGDLSTCTGSLSTCTDDLAATEAELDEHLSPSCGDDVARGDEQCDGSDLEGASCATLGFASGVLGCDSNCDFDASDCLPACGNGTVDPGEECELGVILRTCRDKGFIDGTISCQPGCQVDTSDCRSWGRAFVSSTTNDGNFGGIAGADAFCQVRADAASLGGSWGAWLSSSSANARDRIDNQEYRLVDDTTVIANDLTDLLNGLDAPINQTESGTVTSAVVRTGTTNSGIATAATCNNWTSGSAGDFGTTGMTTETSQWSDSASGINCVPQFPIYCLEQRPARRVFITSSTHVGNFGGLAGADAFCQAHAAGASLGGTWVAWLSSPTVDAKDRITDAVYVAMDGVTIIANSKADLIDGGIDNNILFNESGSLQFPAIMFTGTQSDGTKHSNTCSGWTTVGGDGAFGKNDFPAASGNWTLNGTTAICSGNFARIYCFEQ